MILFLKLKIADIGPFRLLFSIYLSVISSIFRPLPVLNRVTPFRPSSRVTRSGCYLKDFK